MSVRAFKNVFSNDKQTEAEQKLKALNKSLAIIEFDTDGNILRANKNFLSAMGYTPEEIIGKHHSIFVAEDYAKSEEYRVFWDKLRRGEFDTAEYKRYGKGGKEVWIQASYNPIINSKGEVKKVVKYASDITAQKLKNADYEGQIEAINKAQAVIEFNMDGTIIRANKNFLDTMGYSAEEVTGEHHQMFVDDTYAKSEEYSQFWASLREGKYQTAEYKRYGKGGKEVWIQASYNPIYDMNGQPFKVVKYATDVTEQKLENADHQGQIEAINKAQAVIEFELDGTIIDANENFLSTMGYSIEEVEGRHHRIFVEETEAKSKEYEAFWASLRNGIFQSRVFRRISKSGNDVWIQASYNPIFDMNGEPFKVVKYATDITDMIRLSERTDENVQSVAAATEELSSSIDEINKNMDASQTATQKIVKKTNASGEASKELVDSMSSMESVVQLIKDIADQVTLLSLNATIEAARAGDAGKGFAVVASEVKSLANETAEATEKITKEISKIQNLSGTVSSSVHEIVDIANSVDNYVNNVAMSIKQQSQATQEISKNAQTASTAVKEIVDHIKKDDE